MEAALGVGVPLAAASPVTARGLPAAAGAILAALAGRRYEPSARPDRIHSGLMSMSFDRLATAWTRPSPGLPHIALFVLGLTHYQLGDHAGALPLFNAAIDNLPARPAGLQAGFLYFFRANGRARTGQPLAEVVADLVKAQAMNPGVVEIRENLAKAYAGACKPDGSTALDSALAEIMLALQAGQRGSASEQTRADLEAAYRRLGRNTDARRVAGLAATPVATPTTPLSSTLALADQA